MTPSALLPGWLVFERLQHSIDARILNADALGAEEALADLLDDFANGFTPTAEYVKRRFRSLRQNRSRKHRHRFALASATARSEHVAEDTGRVDDADQLRFVKDHVTPDEWRCSSTLPLATPAMTRPARPPHQRGRSARAFAGSGVACATRRSAPPTM